MGMLKTFMKKSFNSAGYDIMRLSNNPMHTFLGLRTLPIRSVIDVGANVGQFGRSIKKIFPDSKIYCFEPLPEPFKKLGKWAITCQGNVEVFNMALGEKEDEVEMFFHVDHSASSSLLKSTECNENLYPFMRKQVSTAIKMSTLDHIFAESPDSLANEILIKIDTQGYEDRVIKGGSEVFSRARACILEINLYALYEGQASFNNIVQLLNDKGFNYQGNLSQMYSNDGHVMYLDAVFIR